MTRRSTRLQQCDDESPASTRRDDGRKDVVVLMTKKASDAINKKGSHGAMTCVSGIGISNHVSTRCHTMMLCGHL